MFSSHDRKQSYILNITLKYKKCDREQNGHKKENVSNLRVNNVKI